MGNGAGTYASAQRLLIVYVAKEYNVFDGGIQCL